MKNLIYTLLIILLPIFSFTQKAEKYKFKKVSKELLLEKAHPLHPDAEAAYDQKRCEIKFDYNENSGFVCVTTISERIKIYKEAGKKEGNLEFTLYRKNNTLREKISKIDAFTYNLERGEIVKTKLSKEDIFETSLNDKYDSYKVAMPNVQEGSVLEIRYTFTTPFYFHIDPFYIQSTYPINNLSYESEFPEYFEYNPIVQGALEINEKRTSQTGTIKVDNNSQTITYVSNNWLIEKQDIPPLSNESFVHNMINFMSAISWELRSTDFPGSFMKKYNTSWNDVARLLNENPKFGNYIKTNNGEIKEILASIESIDEAEKAQAIYDFVSLGYEWDGKYSEIGGNMKKFLKDKKGNSGQINLFLVNLLQKAGIDAVPIVLKSRRQGYLNISYPTIGELNYVIAGIRTEKEIIYLDATLRHLPMGSLPNRAVNLFGVIIEGETGTKIDITSPNNEVYTHFAKAELFENGELKGNLSSKYYKYSNYNERVKLFYNKSEDKYFSNLEQKHQKVSCSNFEIENNEFVKKPLVVSMDVDYSELIQEIDGKIFIPSLLNLGIDENPFRQGERNFNLNFDALHSSKLIVNLVLPEGYTIENAPEPISIALPDKSVIYRFNITQMNNTLNISSFIDRKTDYVTYDQYASLREIYEEILKKSNEQIVLVKN